MITAALRSLQLYVLTCICQRGQIVIQITFLGQLNRSMCWANCRYCSSITTVVTLCSIHYTHVLYSCTYVKYAQSNLNLLTELSSWFSHNWCFSKPLKAIAPVLNWLVAMCCLTPCPLFFFSGGKIKRKFTHNTNVYV